MRFNSLLSLCLAGFLSLMVAPTLRAQTPTSETYYTAGNQLYQAKNYEQALKYFQAAVQLDPKNEPAWLGAGNCQYSLGLKAEALGSYEQARTLNPEDSQLASLVQSIKTQLGVSTAGTAVSAEAGATSAAPAPFSTGTGLHTLKSTRGKGETKKTGVRVIPCFAFINLKDFQSYADALQSMIDTAKLSDPNLTSAIKVPKHFLQYGFELIHPFNPRLEISASVAVLPVGSFTFADSSDTFADSGAVKISGFATGINGRYRFGQGRIKPFVSPSIVFAPLQLKWTETDISAGVTTRTIDCTAKSNAVGFQLLAGADYNLGPSFALSPTLGYRMAKAKKFKGSLTAVRPTGTNSYNGSFVMYDKDNFGPSFQFKSDTSTTVNPGERSLEINLGGLMAGLTLTGYF